MLCSQISKNEINLCICAGFEFLIKRNFLNLFAEGILNIHPVHPLIEVAIIHFGQFTKRLTMDVHYII